MVEKIMDLILVFNFIVLIGLAAGIRSWQKKYGRLSEKKFALILCGFWTFFTITTFAPLISINLEVALVVTIFLLLGFWGIGYSWSRWLWRKFNPAGK
jgi:hypothetical protein